MAAGDEAAAAGLSVVPATADVRQGYAAINTRGDELARHQTSGTHPFTRITGQAQTSQIADAAITDAKLRTNAVTTRTLAVSAVTQTRIADDAVSGPKIINGVISREKLAQRYSAGTATIGAGPAGLRIAHGLTAGATVAVVVTPRGPDGAGATYVAMPDPDAPSTRFWLRAYGDVLTHPVQWIAMEVD